MKLTITTRGYAARSHQRNGEDVHASDPVRQLHLRSVIVNRTSVTVEDQTISGQDYMGPTADDFMPLGTYALQPPWITFPDGTEDGPEPIRVKCLIAGA